MMCFSLLFFVLSSHVPSSSCGANQKCCPDGECYDLGPPWQTPERLVPDPDCVVDPVFFLYKSKSNMNSPVTITLDNYTKLGSDYDPSKPTAIAFHGWMQSADASLVSTLTDVYLSVSPDANVWFCDYSKVAENINYPQAVSDIRVVARYVKKILDFLINVKGTNISQIHLVGGSLGAHLAAYVGKIMPAIGRITGLDPAGPLFRHADCEVRFCKGDANYTEALHTNGNPLWGLGTSDFDSAHVTFLASGGYDQPGCLREQKLSGFLNFKDFSNVETPLDIAVCSHKRLLSYYTEALQSKNCTFWGVNAAPIITKLSQWTLGHATKFLVHPERCTYETCVPFGLDTINYTSEGTYLMRVNPTSPYCVS